MPVIVISGQRGRSVSTCAYSATGSRWETYRGADRRSASVVFVHGVQWQAGL